MERMNEHTKNKRKLKIYNIIFIGRKVELATPSPNITYFCRFNGAHSNRTIEPNKTLNLG